MTSYLRPASLALILGLAAVAPGCNDDDDNVTNPPAPIETPTPAPTPTPTPAPSVSPSPSPSPDTGEDLVFVGKVVTINPPSLDVAGREVLTTESTTILRGGGTILLTDLRAGEVVRVKATLLGDDTVLAFKIVVEE